MYPKKDSIDFDSGYYFRVISFLVAALLSCVCIYFFWVEACQDHPDYKKIGAVTVFVVLIWGIVLLIRSLFNNDSKHKEVEDLFRSIREATKQARKNATNS